MIQLRHRKHNPSSEQKSKIKFLYIYIRKFTKYIKWSLRNILIIFGIKEK